MGGLDGIHVYVPGQCVFPAALAEVCAFAGQFELDGGGGDADGGAESAESADAVLVLV